ncbi:hypothetical protein CR513_59824, partial [Mucuna pruriens]
MDITKLGREKGTNEKQPSRSSLISESHTYMCGVYFDDIIIYSTCVDGHIMKLSNTIYCIRSFWFTMTMKPSNICGANIS